MSASKLEFRLQHVDRHCGARCGQLVTERGIVDLPAFMPVGTLGTVKGLTMDLVRSTGAQMVLANTYHLTLRPGEQVVAELGGLHRFADWHGPILTDSGGFQIFSLAKLTRVTDHSARFRSHIDGRDVELTPERSVEIQKILGSDIAMVLDDVVALPASRARVIEAMDRTVAWAGRCLRYLETRPQQGERIPSLFAIVQGGLDSGLRQRCAEQLCGMDFDGFAVGGLSVGEPPVDMYRTLETTCPHLPRDKPRYLMGVGRPADLIESILRGIDLFDCVMPTRNGRNGLAFTDLGPLRLRNQVHRTDSEPIQKGFEEPFGEVSRGYLRHLFMAGEMLGPILLSAHNLTYYQHLLQQAREAIRADCFLDFRREKMAGWGEALCPCPLSDKVLR